MRQFVDRLDNSLNQQVQTITTHSNYLANLNQRTIIHEGTIDPTLTRIIHQQLHTNGLTLAGLSNQNERHP